MSCSSSSKNNKSQGKYKRDWRNVDNMQNLAGGSIASDLVMADTMKDPILMDHVLPPRIRQKGYDDGYDSMYGGSTKSMKGGSLASDMVMDNLSLNSQTKKYLSENKVEANMASLNLYQTTGGGTPKKLSGGSRKRRSNRKNKRTQKKSKRQQRGGNPLKKQCGGNPLKKQMKGGNPLKKQMKGGNPLKKQCGGNLKKQMKGGFTKKMMKGGGSDWIMSNYSQGNINAPAQPFSWTGQFGVSQPSERDMLMNPPTLGLAGSGYPMGSLEGANVRMTGAPLA
jgi:hypothetical protein